MKSHTRACGTIAIMRLPVLIRVYRLSIFAITLLVGTCAAAPNTYSNVDTSIEFTKYKTFGFFEYLATDSADYESMETRYLKRSVTREMQARNYTYSDQPDLKINFHINTEDKIRARQAPMMGGYYGYRGSLYGAWGGYETRIDQYTQGTLNIDVVDMRTNKLVWEGMMVGSITEKAFNNLSAAINKAVYQIYKSYPVPPATEDPMFVR